MKLKSEKNILWLAKVDAKTLVIFGAVNERNFVFLVGFKVSVVVDCTIVGDTWDESELVELIKCMKLLEVSIVESDLVKDVVLVFK